MDESTEGHKIFREIGINQWYMYSEKYSAFFEWFTQNVTYATFYKDSEKRQFGDLLDEGLVLSKPELDRELVRYEAELEDINIGDVELAQLEADILLCTDIDNELAQLIEDTKKTSTKITQQQAATQQLRECQRTKETALAAQCLERARDVQEHQLANVQRIKELNRFFAVDQLTPVFIHQMGMHSYYQQSDIFIKYLEQYMQSNFRLQGAAGAADMSSSAGDSYDSNDESVDSQPESDASNSGQLEIINYKLYTASVELARCQMKLSANRNVYRTEALDKWQPPDGSASRTALVAKTAELTRMNDEYLDVELENALDALTFVLRQLASLSVETGAFENTRTKLRRAEERLGQLHDVQQIVAENLLNAEVVWLLMQFDLEKLRNRSLSGVLEVYATEAREVARRTEQMQQRGNVASTTTVSMGDWFVAAVQQAFLTHLPHMWQTPGVRQADVFGLYERVVINASTSLRSLRTPRMHPQIELRLKEIGYHVAIQCSFVKDSPNGGIMLHDVQKKNILFAVRRRVKEIESRVGEFKSNYIKQYTEPMNNNPFVQAKRLLWVWFLTEPKVVLKALKSITAAAKATASSRAQNPAVKTISGIMRQD